MPGATFIRSDGAAARERTPECPRLDPEKPADESIPAQEMV